LVFLNGETMAIKMAMHRQAMSWIIIIRG